MFNRGNLITFCLLLATTSLCSQTVITYSFDENNTGHKIKKGKVEFPEAGALQGKVIKLSPNTVVSYELPLQPASIYKITAWMRTESGADDVTLLIGQPKRNNLSITTALATWTKFERTFDIPADQQNTQMEFIFGNTQGNTHAWIDEICIERVDDYNERIYTSIPEACKRKIKTEMGIEMQPDEKIQWMLDDKLGMFIHWGLYAGPAQGEWYMENKGINPEEYRKLAYPESDKLYFDAKDFDADKWVELAKKAGMRYMNMVAQHHDGYALYESKYMNAFTSKQTHNRDFVKEYIEACRAGGLRVGLFKTLINWRFPGYYDITGSDCKPNKFGYTTNPVHKENARLMKEEVYCQVKELLTNYGPIDQLFWDGGWLSQQGSDADAAYFWESGKYQDTNNEWPVNPYFQDTDEFTGKPLGLMGIARKYQPDMVVNPRSGWCGDYTCEEGSGSITGNIRNGVVEKCISLSPGWGYNSTVENPERIMPLRSIKRIFADCMVRNMCFLVNIGPDRHGTVAPLIENRLLEFGNWVNHMAEAIYGTRGGPWQPIDGEYGFCYKDNIIYIYFLGGYTADTFTLPPINKGMKSIKAYNVYTKKRIKTSQRNQVITLNNLNITPDDITIIAIEINQNIR